MVITRTPFRISFFGGGTDYPIWYKENGGMVLSTTIDKYCYITTRYLPPFFKYKFRLRYRKNELTKNIHQIKHPHIRESLKFLDINNGLEMIHTTDLPDMSGIGSSSSFTVGFLNSLYTLTQKKLTKKSLALDAINVEQNLIGENVGSQDQTSAAFGGFNKIIFSKKGDIAVSQIPINQKRQTEFEDHLMLFFTGFQRRASDIASQIIKNTSKKGKELHEIQQMTQHAYKIFTSSKKSFDEIGHLLDTHWQLKKSLAKTVTTGDIDQIYDTAKKAGALGGKLLGAGGGGFFIFFVKPELQSQVRLKLKKLPLVPFKFENEGSQVIYHLPFGEQWNN